MLSQMKNVIYRAIIPAHTDLTTAIREKLETLPPLEAKIYRVLCQSPRTRIDLSVKLGDDDHRENPALSDSPYYDMDLQPTLDEMMKTSLVEIIPATSSNSFQLTLFDFYVKWVIFRVRASNVSYDVWASGFSTDCLREILEMATDLLVGGSSKTVFFDGENEFYFWFVQRENQTAAIHLYEVDYLEDFDFTPTPELGQLQNTITVEIKTLVEQILQCFAPLHELFSDEEYRQAWNHPFPAEQWRQLTVFYHERYG